MTREPTNIAECDHRLLITHAAFCLACDCGDITAADQAYQELDALLDLRLHLPMQRKP
jgi:hypothetical protein